MALARMRLPAPALVNPPGRGFCGGSAPVRRGSAGSARWPGRRWRGRYSWETPTDPAEREADAAAAGAGPVTLHRSAAGPGGPSTAPPEVHEVIRSSGQPLGG